MKKFILLLFFIGGLVATQAQQSSNDSINDLHRTLILKLGVNLVDSTGEDDPFTAINDFDQIAFSNNYNVELEYRFSRWFSLGAIWSTNRWEANEGNIDGIIVNTDQDYLAIDLDFKFYYDEAIRWFDDKDWLEFYLHGGVGVAYIADNAGVTLNAGPGANIWFTDQFGLNLHGTGKWHLNHNDNLYGTNHFQYSASLMYRFINNDDDNDGVKNSVDDCPNVPGVAANNGCPEEPSDRDGDGVIDTLDNCPDTYATSSNGCPKVEADTDGDGVVDSADNCPKIKGLPTNNGCPLPDSDNDGIVDAADKCPNVSGIASNNGCPFKEVMIGDRDSKLNILSKNILFKTSSSIIKDETFIVLGEMIEIMKQHPEAVFKIEGHTDSKGPSEYNAKLSKNRAITVRDYLVSKGIPSNSLVVEFFGESKPVASNSTIEGRRLNRRVEVIRIKE